MAVLVTATHVYVLGRKTWMAGTRPSAGPAMTIKASYRPYRLPIERRRSLLPAPACIPAQPFVVVS